MSELSILLGAVCFGIGFAIAFWVKGKIITQKVKAAEAEASRLLADSKRKADTFLREADLEVKDRLFKMKSDFDAETKETRSEQKKRESRLMQIATIRKRGDNSTRNAKETSTSTARLPMRRYRPLDGATSICGRSGALSSDAAADPSGTGGGELNSVMSLTNIRPLRSLPRGRRNAQATKSPCSRSGSVPLRGDDQAT